VSERSGVVISTIATVAAMAVLLIGPQVSADEPADRPPPAELTGR
jgi:hypothetical protein